MAAPNSDPPNESADRCTGENVEQHRADAECFTERDHERGRYRAEQADHDQGHRQEE
jgi:hypothetical protein